LTPHQATHKTEQTMRSSSNEDVLRRTPPSVGRGPSPAESEMSSAGSAVASNNSNNTNALKPKPKLKGPRGAELLTKRHPHRTDQPLSRPLIESMVEHRLRSSWGRVEHSTKTSSPAEMHQLISNLREPLRCNDPKTTQSKSSIESHISATASVDYVLSDATYDRRPNSKHADSCDEHNSINNKMKECTFQCPHDDDGVVMDEHWIKLLERCKTHPQETRLLDRRGRNCLHAVCTKNPPLKIINAMLEASSATANRISHRSILEERDKNGRTPLSIAVSCNNSIEVIQRLVHNNPYAVNGSDHLGNLPLHLACDFSKNNNNNLDPSVVTTAPLKKDEKIALVRLLLNVEGSTAGREDNSGCTPLHTAIKNDAPLEVVTMLVEAHPEAVVKKDLIGICPLILAIRNSADVEFIRVMVQANPKATMQRDRCGGLPLKRAMEHQFPQSVLELLCNSKEVVLDTIDASMNTDFHEILEWNIPKVETVNLFLRVAPEIATTENRVGQTPLTLACTKLACTKYARLLGSGAIRRDRDTSQFEHLWATVSLLLIAAKYGHVDGPEDYDDFDVSVERQPQQVPAQRQQQQQLVRQTQAMSIQDRVQRTSPPPAFRPMNNANRYPPRSNVTMLNHNYRIRNNARYPVLHAAVGQDVPMHVIRTALRLHPEQVRLMDCHGKYPLDHALVADTKANKSPLVRALLSNFPQAALPRGGQSTLSLACECRSLAGEIYRVLWTIHPASLSELCPKHHLYPFQIAAMLKPKTNVSDKLRKVTMKWDPPCDDDLLQINSIFTLLTANPSLIAAN